MQLQVLHVIWIRSWRLPVNTKLFVVEDAAQAIDFYYKGRPLGSIGHLVAWTFHETKNIQCGEGGMLLINDEQFYQRAEIILRKERTERSSSGEKLINMDGLDMGSLFTFRYARRFLLAQAESIRQIQDRRTQPSGSSCITGSCNRLQIKDYLDFRWYPPYATNNAHMFYLVCGGMDQRTGIIQQLKRHNILAVSIPQPAQVCLYAATDSAG